MLKSLMLAVACAYINPPGLEPTAPVVQATVPEILKQAYAMEPGTHKEIIINHGDALLHGQVDGDRLFKMILTFTVPYGVSTFSSVSAILRWQTGRQ